LVDLGKIIKDNFGEPVRRDENKRKAGTGIRCHTFAKPFEDLMGEVEQEP